MQHQEQNQHSHKHSRAMPQRLEQLKLAERQKWHHGHNLNGPPDGVRVFILLRDAASRHSTERRHRAADTGDGEGLAVAELDFERLARLRAELPALDHRRL